jgi:hypothetical protein
MAKKDLRSKCPLQIATALKTYHNVIEKQKDVYGGKNNFAI